MNDETLELLEVKKEEHTAPFVPDREKYTVVDIRFRAGGKTYFFDPGDFVLSVGEDVVIDTARGAEFGTVVKGNHDVSATEMVAALRKVIRKATPVDIRTAKELRSREEKALMACQEKADELGLDMQLVSAEWAFDSSKLIFFFTSDGRVDFRELVKILASMFRTRIELRQIGVRDKAKMVGGLGICGQPFCCREFLPDFQPVSIKMAKTQNLSLNPTKISGTCGRLMCCLKYEQDCYEALIHDAPRVDSLVDTPDGRGTITEVCLLKEAVKVRMEKDPDSINCYKNCDVCVLRSGKAKRDDREEFPFSPPPQSSREEERKEPEPFMPEIIYRNNSLNTPKESISEEPSEAAAETPQVKGQENGQKPKHRNNRRRYYHGKKSNKNKET